MEESEDIFSSAEIVVHDLIEELIQKGSESLYDRYLEERSTGFSVKSTLAVLSSTIELFLYRREPGEPKIWEEAAEPNPSSVDTWVRKAVPMKKVVAMNKLSSPTVTLPDAKSVISHSTRRTLQQRLGRTNRGRNTKENEVIDEPTLAVPIEDDAIEMDEEIESLRNLKERQAKKKKDEQQRLKSIKEEEEAKEKKIQKDSETMKNKAFTYDYGGKIVLIAPPKMENLPNLNQTARFEIQEPVVEEVKVQKKRKTLDILPAKRNKTAPLSEQEWVKNLTTGQQAMFDVIKLSPGVALIDGVRSKQCVDNTNEPKTMTRKEYNSLQKTSLASAGGIAAGKLERRSSVGSSIDSELKNNEGKGGFFDSIPDFEELKDVPGTSHLSSSMSPVRTRKSYGKVVKFGNSFEINESSGPTDKFNAEILKSKNWGLNPPNKDPRVIERVPKKSTNSDLRELYGDIVKKPKDKPFITPKELWEAQGPYIKKPRDRPNIERIEKKTRMPPPPYGFTMINALPEISGLGNSMISHRSVNESKH